jgi:hypothetical protein
MSVLVGFITIFIGVFMVNDAKALNNSIIDKARSARNSYNIESGVEMEFYPLTQMEDHSNLIPKEEIKSRYT